MAISDIKLHVGAQFAAAYLVAYPLTQWAVVAPSTPLLQRAYLQFSRNFEPDEEPVSANNGRFLIWPNGSRLVFFDERQLEDNEPNGYMFSGALVYATDHFVNPVSLAAITVRVKEDPKTILFC